MRPLKIALLVLLALAVTIPACGPDERAARDTAPGDALTGALAGRDFILVVADSFHARHSSAYGYPRPTTPFLRSLSERGVRAERALSQTSWTLSSVVSLMTGHVQESHGVLGADNQLPEHGPRTLAEMFRARGYRTVGFVENAAVSPATGLARGFDRYEYIRFMGVDGPKELQRRAGELFAEKDERPLFLYVHLLPPHMPYRPPSPFDALFDESIDGKRAPSDVIGTNGDVARIQAEQLPQDHPDVLRLIERYDAHIAYADDRIRTLVEPRLQGEVGARTAVLVTSDHGEAFMQHRRTGHNACVFDEMVHVPWVLAAPGALEGGQVLPGPTSLLDTLPTVAQLFDLRLPPAAIDGRSNVDRFGGVGPERPRELYLSSRYPASGKTAQYGLVKGRWKYVTRRREGRPLLFDTDEDPDEERDLLDALPERAEDMARRLAQRRSALAREHRDVLSAPLTETIIKDLEALGYGGANFDRIESRDER